MPDPANLNMSSAGSRNSTIVRPQPLPTTQGPSGNTDTYGHPGNAGWILDPNNAYSNRPPGSTADYDPFEHMQYLQAGQPISPEYHPGYDPLTMSNSRNVDSQLSQLGTHQGGLDKFRQEATRSGPSNWAGLAHAQQGLATQNSLNKASQSAAGQTAGANSRLSMQGGESSGARERVARAGANNALDMSQGIRQSGDQNNMQIGINDEQNRISQLGQLPGMENANTASQLSLINQSQAAHQQDVSNLSTEAGARNSFNADKNKMQLGAWGAKNIGDATLLSGKGGGGK